MSPLRNNLGSSAQPPTWTWQLRPSTSRHASRLALLFATLGLFGVTTAIGLAPTEATMGQAQRIMYVHVAVAWSALICYILVAASGVTYLLRRDLTWDHWAQASAELGWLCSCLTLATGSIWARSAWGTWWTWDPRLLTSFILWSILGGYLISRASLDDLHLRARLSAVLAIIGLLDIPLVLMATRWFRAMHPVAPTLAPPMRLTLILAVACFAALVAKLIQLRRNQIDLEVRLTRLSQTLESESLDGLAPGLPSRAFSLTSPWQEEG